MSNALVPNGADVSWQLLLRQHSFNFVLLLSDTPHNLCNKVTRKNCSKTGGGYPAMGSTEVQHKAEIILVAPFIVLLCKREEGSICYCAGSILL